MIAERSGPSRALPTSDDLAACDPRARSPAVLRRARTLATSESFDGARAASGCVTVRNRARWPRGGRSSSRRTRTVMSSLPMADLRGLVALRRSYARRARRSGDTVSPLSAARPAIDSRRCSSGRPGENFTCTSWMPGVVSEDRARCSFGDGARCRGRSFPRTSIMIGASVFPLPRRTAGSVTATLDVGRVELQHATRAPRLFSTDRIDRGALDPSATVTTRHAILLISFGRGRWSRRSSCTSGRLRPVPSSASRCERRDDSSSEVPAGSSASMTVNWPRSSDDDELVAGQTSR